MGVLTPEQWRHVERLFAEASALETGPRAAYLDRACADAPAVRTQVESMLSARRRMAGFMSGPVIGQAPTPARREDEEEVERLIGRRIGAYRLLRPVGRGGMGDVWLAERADGVFEQHVAIKLIGRSRGGLGLLARFEQERQVLADLAHPGIARLLDGGATGDGCHYFVMEFVDGLPIDRYCDERRLSVRQRLELFRRVAEAVQYAHARLVVHRDLKPANVLVTESGQPKLLDFGIAKVLESEADHQDQATATDARLMTPRYASPEQVRGERVTTASDVYSLGVMLFELLTGQTPYGPETAFGWAYQRAICEVEPTRPSSVVTNRQLRGQLAGDLDVITLTALRKEPERRYATVEQLSEDIRRHLVGLPVRARPDTLLYRATTFARRNRLAVSAAALLLLLAAGWLSTSTALYFNASAERREAQRQAYSASVAAAESAIRASRVADARRHLEAAPARLRGWEWRHFLWRSDRSLRTLDPARARAGSLAFLGGDRLLTLSRRPGELCAWDSASGEPLASIELGLEATVATFAPAPAGDSVVWIPDPPDGAARLLDLKSGATTELGGHRRTGPRNVAFSGDGRVLATGSWHGETALWDVQTAALVRRWTTHERRQHCVVLDPSGTLLATSGEQLEQEGAPRRHSIRLWSVDDGRMIAELSGHRRDIVGLAFDDSGSRLASVSLDRVIMVWDLASPRAPLQSMRHNSPLCAVSFLPDGERLATSDGDGSVQLWSVGSARPVSVLRGHTEAARHLAVDEEGRLLATSADDGTTKVWSTASRDVPRIVAAAGWIHRLVASADGARLATSVDGRVQVWDAVSFAPVATVEIDLASGVQKRAVAVSPDGGLVAVPAPGAVLVLSVDEGREIARLDHETSVCVFHPADGALVLGGADGLLRLWDHGTGADRTLRGPAGSIHTLEFDRDGARLAAGDTAGNVWIWSWPEGRLLGRVRLGRGMAADLAFTPAGRMLAAARRFGHGVVVWDVDTGGRVAEMSGLGLTLAVTFSPDGTRLVAGSRDAIKLWSTAGWRHVGTLHGHESDVRGLLFTSPQTLVSASADGTVRFWHAAAGQ